MFLPNVFGDKLFDDYLDFPSFTGRRDNSLMKTDIKDEGDHYELMVDMPGFNKEDVKAQLSDGYLTIEAETKTQNDETDDEGKYIRRERFIGSCSRSFYVGDDIKQEDIKARFDKGVLSISVKKVEELPPEEEDKFISIE
jgi:Molecular chaperone (small heat shock protein)